MTKRQLIDEIIRINRTARASFLARFDEVDLDEYLRHLRQAHVSQVSGDWSRYSQYFPEKAVAEAKEPVAVASQATAVLDAPTSACDSGQYAVVAPVVEEALAQSEPAAREPIVSPARLLPKMRTEEDSPAVTPSASSTLATFLF
jgi:hypothetical protein